MASPTRFSRFRPYATRYVNPITRLFAGWMPSFALLIYKGRTSGRTYRTPVNVFRRGNQYVFFLTYGSETQWVKNVLAAGGCQMRRLGRQITLVEPRLIVDPNRTLVPKPVRFVGRLGRVTQFLIMRAA
jgi:deazaflavin-dependent oxidoreductase (nitroreductase family)